MCIHVEQIIGLFKQKFRILEDPMPLNLIESTTNEEFFTVDKIVTVYSALTNLTESIVGKS